MSSFSSRRKARVIKVDDDDETGLGNPATAAAGDESLKKPVGSSEPTPTAKFTKKPFRQSGLRKSINISEDADETPGDASTSKGTSNAEDEDHGPVVVRPSVGRKKRSSSSRLAFGRNRHSSDGDGDGDGDSASSTVAPKRTTTLSQQALENNAVKKAPLFTQRLPLRRFENDDDDDDGRPRYSKESLAELQNSTPQRPQGEPVSLSSLSLSLSSSSQHGQTQTADDEMELDPSELEGAVIVHESELGRVPAPAPTAASKTTILTDAEIQERKQRRARLALEEEQEEEPDDFISLEDEYPDDPLASARRRKKQQADNNNNNSRLVPEDEDLGEGFDDFVEDGGLSLGKKAEREARDRRRREMAERIQEAEGNSEEDSDDSEAERRAAFEAAQTRSGMDGLAKPRVGLAAGPGRPDEALLQPPSRITPLPELEGCLDGLRVALQNKEVELREKRARVAELKDERAAILQREGEVQSLLDEAGRKYHAALGGRGATVTLPGTVEAGVSPARQIQSVGLSELAVERGLESFGTTPNRRSDVGEEA
ncbi:hypothetical protein SODALDRAFT_349820 [Sodiomyces alkalinus F11]|uniref:Nineteen complex-related protein 2-domain-containing protein n=1 Tax=Sodiomyces alkalinus (strain CBS 110278 / VKM F-3762 / F11) TaxID=1314773 RepID=A0A3N2PYS7_SODAK|nr:hypothetical protein SODALDRAFT_349820 [Sodiomyces alkalinus F11]ROT39644.1 hypothetical protein SODALDRAFT_349820 [Sodiomyces alkalinus F11]